MWAHDFVDVPGRHWSDIAHFSPPCQVWSPVHTRVGQDDEQNFNSLFSLEELLLKVRPRIATVEQTFGILHPTFAPMFNTAIVKAFTDCGYSVRWELVEFHRYGLAQKRKRLILIAAWYAPLVSSRYIANNLQPRRDLARVASLYPLR